jgi:hypothetical protein
MVYAEHISFLYSISRAVRFAVVIHPKYIKEDEFVDLLNVYTPALRKLRVGLSPTRRVFNKVSSLGPAQHSASDYRLCVTAHPHARG